MKTFNINTCFVFAKSPRNTRCAGEHLYVTVNGSSGNMGGILGVLFPVVDITHPTRREIYNAADMSTGGIVAIIYGLVLGA
jgi:hypothetical protein